MVMAVYPRFIASRFEKNSVSEVGKSVSSSETKDIRVVRPFRHIAGRSYHPLFHKTQTMLYIDLCTLRSLSTFLLLK